MIGLSMVALEGGIAGGEKEGPFYGCEHGSGYGLCSLFPLTYTTCAGSTVEQGLMTTNNSNIFCPQSPYPQAGDRSRRHPTIKATIDNPQNSSKFTQLTLALFRFIAEEVPVGKGHGLS